MVKTGWRHGRRRNFSITVGSGFKIFHRLPVAGEGWQSGNRRRHRRPRHEPGRLEVQFCPLQPMFPVLPAFPIAGRMTIRANRHPFHEIFAALDLRVSRRFRPDRAGDAYAEQGQNERKEGFGFHARLSSDSASPEQVKTNPNARRFPWLASAPAFTRPSPSGDTFLAASRA